MEELGNTLSVVAFLLFQILAFVAIYSMNPFTAVLFVLSWTNIYHRARMDKLSKDKK